MNLSNLRYKILIYLYNNSILANGLPKREVTGTGIAEGLEKKLQDIYKLLRNMERDGLIEKIPELGRKPIHFRLSENGRKIAIAILGPHREKIKVYNNAISLKYKYIESRGIAHFRTFIFSSSMEYNEAFIVPFVKKEMKDFQVREENPEVYDNVDQEKVLEQTEVGNHHKMMGMAISPVKEVPPQPFPKAFMENRIMVILGDPGSGKTTLLKYVAFHCALGEEEKNLGIKENCMPVFVALRDYSARLKKQENISLEQFLRISVNKVEEGMGPILMELLKDGKCIVLLDGLDEVSDLFRRRSVVDDVQLLMSKYPKNRFIVTSRISGYKDVWLSGEHPHFMIQDFTGEQVREFLEKWFVTLALKSKKEGELNDSETRWLKAKGVQTAKSLHYFIMINENISRLAVNPLMLTILGLIYAQGIRIPRNRVELYRECTDTLVDTWDHLKGKTSREYLSIPHPDEVREILEIVAWRLHKEYEENVVPSEKLREWIVNLLRKDYGKPKDVAQREAGNLIELIHERTGLLIEKGENLFGFPHLTFQEYFVALYLSRDPDIAREVIQDHLHESEWQEVILLLLGLERRKNIVTNYMELIVNRGSLYEELTHVDLLFAGKCLTDDIHIDNSKKREIIDRIMEVFRKTKIPALRDELGTIIGMCAGTKSERRLREHLLSLLNYRNKDVRRATIEAISNMGLSDQKTLKQMIDLINDEDENVRRTVKQAIGNIGFLNNEIVMQIIALTKDEYLDVHRELSEEIRKIEVTDSNENMRVVTLLNHKDAFIRQSALCAIRILGSADEKIIKNVFTLMKDDNSFIRRNAIEVIGTIGITDKNAVMKIIQLFKDNEWDVRETAVTTIGDMEIMDKATIKEVLALFKDDNECVRSAAVKAIGTMGVSGDYVIKQVISLFKDINEHVRAAAVETFGTIGASGEGIIKQVIGLFKDEIIYVRHTAVKAIGTLRVSEDYIVKQVIALFKDEDEYVRRAAVETFGTMGISEEVILKQVIALFKDKNEYVRCATVKAIGTLGVSDEKIVKKVIALLKDENEYVRHDAVEAISNMRVSDEKTVKKIIILLKDKYWFVRRSAVEAIGTLGVSDEKIVNEVITLLKDENEYVREATVEVIGILRFTDVNTVKLIIDLFKDESEIVRDSAYQFLTTYSKNQIIEL